MFLYQHLSDQGNQHNNGPYQDQILDNPSALCLALWAKNRTWLGEGGGGTDAPNRLFMKGVRLSVFPFFCGQIRSV